MSNIGQIGSAVVGGVIGFVVSGFNPVGAAYGFQIGLMAGTLLFPTKLPTVFGPRQEDIVVTVAQIGSPVGITYGTFAVPGQVIAIGCVTETESRERVGGKGHRQTVVSFGYTQTLAVGLCEGVICGVQRIWENGELKYDLRDPQPEETGDDYAARLEMSGTYALTFTLYLGDELQEPDPALEIVFGATFVPAFRGLAYIVFPDREMREDQAFRHPTWRFEVFRGIGERSVTAPTLLTGALTGFDITVLMPDWVRNRFFTIDYSGDGGATGIRAFALHTNTEVLQRTFWDIGIGTPGDDPIAFYKSHVGIDGFIYLCATWHNQGPAVFYRIDPVTLDVVESSTGPLSQNQWINLTSVTASGFGISATFLCTASLLGNHFKVRNAETFGQLSTFGDGREEGRWVRGRVVRNVVTENAYAYAFSFDESQAGATDGIDVYVADCRIELVIGILTFEPAPRASITLVGTLEPAAMQADWIRIVVVEGFVYDVDDDTVIVTVTGSPDTSGGNIQKRIVKFNPETLAIVWNVVAVASHGVTYDDNHNLSRVAGGRYVVAKSLSAQLNVIDTVTGEQTEEDYAGDLPGNETLTGEEIWDGITGCLITYISDVGPVLICLESCASVPITLGEIVADVCDRSGVPVGGYDVSELTQTVLGYGVLRNMSGRDAIEPLRPVGSFDGVESGTVIRFPVRGRAASDTYDLDDLGAHLAGEAVPPAVSVDKQQAVELPRIVRMHYIAPTREYEPGEKLSPSRFSPGIIHEVDSEVPVALDDDQAAQIAEIMHTDAWVSRWKYRVVIDVSKLAIEPTDVVLLPVDGRLYRCRVTDIEDAGGGLLRKLNLVRDDDSSYVSTAASDPPLSLPPPGVVIRSETLLVLMDLPPLNEADDDPGIYAAVYRATPGFTWTGAIVLRSVDAGTTWDQIAATSSEATVGNITQVLDVGSPATWDTANELIISVDAGTFESQTDTAVLNGANLVAVGAHGRWELVQFANAELIGVNTARLTRLLRGRRGTEVFIGTSVAGDLAVLLTTATTMRLPLQTTDIGQEHQYRAATVGMSSAVATIQAFTGAGRALQSWAPVYIRGARDGGDDLTITFSRRSRFGSDLTPASQNLPLTEAPEDYDIDIIGDSAGEVLRTISTSVESAVYTSAQQTTDFGAPQAAVWVRIYQISVTVGRGLVGEGTI
jgi:hypothetical protein